MWRDGENAIKIQAAMVEVARARLFDHGTRDRSRPASVGLPLPASMAYHLAIVIHGSTPFLRNTKGDSRAKYKISLLTRSCVCVRARS